MRRIYKIIVINLPIFIRARTGGADCELKGIEEGFHQGPKNVNKYGIRLFGFSESERREGFNE